jgi:hypothetical protein
MLTATCRPTAATYRGTPICAPTPTGHSQIPKRTLRKLIHVILKKLSQDNRSESAQGKIFKKNRICLAVGCGRRYSSRISLRAHMRKCHEEKLLKEEKKAYKLT